MDTAVDAGPGGTFVGSSRICRTTPLIAAFAVAGLLLIIAAVRTIRRHRHHVDRRRTTRHS